MEAGHAALIVRQKLDIRAQSGANHVDVLRPHARADDEAVLPGHQIHRASTCADHAARCVDPQVGDDASLGRLDLGSRELI